MASSYSPREFLRQFSDTGLPDFARTLLPASASPHPGETAVVALQCPRMAALCFDRVWSIPLDQTECPIDIGFSASSDAELVAALWMHVWNNSESTLRSFTEYDEFAEMLKSGDYKIMSRRPNFMAAYSMLLMTTALTGSFDFAEKEPVQAMSRALCDGLQQALGKRVIPVYGSEAARDAQYQAGEHEVVVASLRQLEVVDEESLSWEQVREFRSDAGTRADYRRLVHWLDSDLVGKEWQYVVDEIGIRLEKYRSALRKHGLKSRMGVLASVLDSKSLLPAGAAVGGSLVAGEPLWGALAAGGVLFGKVLMAVGQSKLDLDDIREEYKEVAFVAQVNERFTNP